MHKKHKKQMSYFHHIWRNSLLFSPRVPLWSNFPLLHRQCGFQSNKYFINESKKTLKCQTAINWSFKTETNCSWNGLNQSDNRMWLTKSLFTHLLGKARYIHFKTHPRLNAQRYHSARSLGERFSLINKAKWGKFKCALDMVFKQNQRAETQYLDNTIHYSLGKENGPQQMAHRIPI